MPSVAGNSVVLYKGNSVELYRGSERKKLYNLSFDNNLTALQREITESFRQAVSERRPVPANFINGDFKNEVGRQYFRKFIKDYETIIRDLDELKGTAHTHTLDRKGREALASARVAKLSKVGEKIRQFLADRVERPAEQTGLYVRYSYKNGKILVERHNIIGRGWRWIADKFATGKNYYRRREALSFFTALGRKYSLEDITEKTLEHLRLEGKNINEFRPDVLAALSADGKMSLLESLESGHAKQQRTAAPYRISREQSELLGSHPQVAGKPGSESRMLLSAFVAAYGGDIEAAAKGFAAMTLKQRESIHNGLSAIRGLSGDFLQAAAERDKQKAAEAMRKINRVIVTQAFDILDEADLGKPEDSGLPMRLVEMMKMPMMNSPSLLTGAARPGLRAFGDRIAAELASELPTHEELESRQADHPKGGGETEAKRRPEGERGGSGKNSRRVRTSGVPELRREIMLLKQSFTEEVIKLLTEAPAAKTAEQSWREGLVETFETDEEGGLRFIAPAVRAEPGSVRWYEQAAEAKQSLLTAVGKKYMADAEPSSRRQINHRLDSLQEKPFISREEALDVLRFAAEEQRLQNFSRDNQILTGHKKIEEILPRYEIGGIGWKKLIETRDIKEPEELNSLFLRRVRLMLTSNQDLLQAVIGADLERFLSRKQTPEAETLIEKRLGGLLDKLIIMRKNRPRDYQALKGLDEQADEATLEYVAALKRRASAGIYQATEKMVNLMFRYMLLDPHISLLGDRERVAKGGLSAANFVNGADEFAGMSNLVMVNALVKQGRENAPELAKSYKEVAVSMGWVDGAAMGFITGLMMDIHEKAEAESGIKSPSRLSVDGSPAYSTSPRDFRRSISSFDKFVAQFRAGQFQEDTGISRRAGWYGRSAVLSPVEKDNGMRASMDSIDEDIEIEDAVNFSIMGREYGAVPLLKNPKREILQERKQADLKSLFRNYSSQLIPTLTSTLDGLGAGKEAWEAFNIYLNAMEYAEAVVERANMSVDSTDAMFPGKFQALMNQKINEFAEKEDLRPDFEGSVPPMPSSSADRIQLLEDFDVFNKKQGQELSELRKQADKIINQGIRTIP